MRMLGITAAWGACFVAVSWGLRDAPVLWFAALRAVVAGAALAAVSVAQRRVWPTTPAAWSTIAVVGVVNVTLSFAAMFAGIAGGSAGVAAVLANAQPLLIVIPAWLLFGEVMSMRVLTALGAGFAGLVVVAVPGGGGRGALMSLLSAVAITAGTLTVKRVQDVDIVVFSAAHLILGGLLLVVLAATVEGGPSINWSPRFVALLLFVALIGTAASFVAWFVETQRCDLARLAVWTFLVPVFGIAFAVLLLGEPLDSWTTAGMALVLGAMWVVLRTPDAAPAVPTHSHVLPLGRPGP